MLSSEEVGTLITALGCGIGREEYDPNKLRYHRIIIMTDADIDGSHIRTLLLTFFYRQMPELIERGHIYIAQPPLYKVKKGKQEQYVKDDTELDNYLLQLTLEKTRLHIDETTPPIQGQGLEQLAREYLSVQSLIERLAHRYDETLLDLLVDHPVLDPATIADRPKCEAWFATLTERLNADSRSANFAISLEFSKQTDEFRAHVSKRLHGVHKTFDIGSGFFGAGDYKRLTAFGQKIEGLFGDHSFIASDDKRERVRNFKEAFQWMMGEAKKGQHIQRYKGLGEMNPEQLWETTLDSNTRRLLQVKIEDAIAADEIFSTLMGDQVEPRRDFIERNALEVANLDV
jgi:DNA gyrase subunit B